MGKKLTVLSYSCKCVVLDHRVSLLYSHPSFLSPSVRSSPQPPVCAPWFIPSSFWRGIPRRTERGAGESRRFRWSSDPLPANQCSSQRLLSKLYGETDRSNRYVKQNVINVSKLKCRIPLVTLDLFERWICNI